PIRVKDHEISGFNSQPPFCRLLFFHDSCCFGVMAIGFSVPSGDAEFRPSASRQLFDNLSDYS
ncbi:MAG: hypothetical protein ABGZ17_20940, partial [Planctomycetaceae bacterium]